jgi:hypothetical protein
MVASMGVTARETWSDERLDDLKENVNQRFDGVDRRFEQVDQRFDRVESSIGEFRREVNTRFDSLQHTMIVCFTGMTASIVASVIGAVLLG